MVNHTYAYVLRVVTTIKRNPVLVGAVVVAGQALLAGDPWRAVLTTLVGVVVRAFVTPETVAQHREQDAYVTGLTDATFGSPG